MIMIPLTVVNKASYACNSKVRPSILLGSQSFICFSKMCNNSSAPSGTINTILLFMINAFIGSSENSTVCLLTNIVGSFNV